jgi:tetratricopeptide (TPR) repeat protein
VLSSLNPVKHWQKFQHNHRWEVANRRFIDLYNQQKFVEADNVARSMNIIAIVSGQVELQIKSCRNSMICYIEMGRLDLAHEQIKKIIKLQLESQDNRAAIESLSDLADLYQRSGQTEESIRIYEKSLELSKGLNGDKSSNQTIKILYGLTLVHIKQHNLYRSQQLLDEFRIYGQKLKLFPDSRLDELERAIESIKPSEDIRYYSNAENITRVEQWQNLMIEAEKFQKEGDVIRAIPIAEEALSIAREIYDDSHKNLASNLNILAVLYFASGRLAKAELLFRNSLSIRRDLFKLYPNKDLANSLGNLARLYAFENEWIKAEPLFRESIEIYTKLFGENGHPDLVNILIDKAKIYAKQNKSHSALPLFNEAIIAENKLLANIIFVRDSEQRMKDLKQREEHLEYLLALTQRYFLNNSQVVTDTFNAVLSRKAQAVNAEATLSRAFRNHPKLTPQIEEYKNYQREIGYLSYAISSQPELKGRLNTTLKQKRELEKELARSIPEIDLAQQVIDRQALTELLPIDAFLVEFICYRDYDFVAQTWQPARYLAFIIRPDVEGVTAIDCGLAQPLNEAIENFRCVYAKNNFNGERSNLRPQPANTTTLEPAPAIAQPDLLSILLPHFPTFRTCYLAPDSKLHILPFHLLKTDEGKYLGDCYSIHYLGTARDLYRRNFPISKNPPVIIADPNYNGGTVPTVAANPKKGFQYNHDIDGAEFEQLEINLILGYKIANRYNVSCYSNLEATVDRLERLNAPQILVIATHGFSVASQQNFIGAIVERKSGEEEQTLRDLQHEITREFRNYWKSQANAGSEWSQKLLAEIDKIRNYKPTDLLATPISDPMLRCGIALAGANIWRFQGTPHPQFGKGVAFARDIAQWDLWGTELALMITCVSGLGEVRNSEGVFGLRRALAIAGAKYTISSLWNIPTKASVLLMDKFFELYQSEARPTPPEALAKAQLYIRDITLGELKQNDIGREIVAELQSDRVRQLDLDATDNVKPLADPHFWGAWICQG